MSEEIIPDVPVTSDVLENEEPVVNYSAMSLAELADMFQKLAISEDRMKRSKEAEAIKSAFYKRLLKERAEAGSTAAVQEPGSAEEDPAVEAEISQAPQPETEEAVSENPFDEIERGFKALYNAYRKEKAEYNRQLEKEREHNLELKEAVIADLKALVEKQEDVNATFPAFREIQNRWRAIGPVPVQNFRNLNDTYQLYVEQFYDMVKINRELRDLDFKKNLEAKEKFCEAAEKLAEKENVVDAFKELQKLHEQSIQLSLVISVRHQMSSLRLMNDPANADKTILLSSHGAAIRGLLTGIWPYANGGTWSGMVHKNCGVTCLHVENGRFDLVFENRIYY